MKEEQPVVFILSDSLGETAELVVRAALSQFNSQGAKIRRVPFVTEAAQVEEVLQEAAGTNCVLAYTFVLPELRRALAAGAARLGLKAVDIMGPILGALEGIMPGAPQLKPGLVHRLDEEYFDRMEAIEFAVRFDNGKDPRGLFRADVVLIGVSRTSKTPLSLYLAHQKVRSANLPLVLGVAPPEELFQLPPEKIIGLTISPAKLVEIRQERLRTMGLEGNADYASTGRIEKEVAYAEEIMARLRCQVLDVTNMAVEEIATKIMQLLKKGDNL
ncbi:pyruvate, water dikinase regulatory protein [Gelria sp. Kuro-4]|uniref:pyruvate, water dikinase regulatory protein n=1 Tax=Gelria sp. Kuro-4 TaxID=2796927 RepID=UPI001C7E2351|nr:pyruvate, water dikinase regulatory protein [Gelria sp. Kuro-4]